MRRLFARSPLLLLPLALFLALFPIAVLDIGNAGWLIRGTDNGENALGLHAYLHDSAAGWSLRSRLLDSPDGVPLLFTDSNPLLGLLTRPFAALLPADAQVVGPWLLACLILQVLVAWALLRRHAPGPAALWLGTLLLAALPTLFNRIVHANLFAHWLILAALWLFLDPRRAGAARWWLPLLAVTALVHSYLLVMVGAIWASAMLECFVAVPAMRWRLAGQVAAVLAGVALVATWLGAGGDFIPTHNYGAFAMPLDALVNPANSDYSTLLPATGQREGRGFEGFQYLGAGVLLLIMVAIGVAIRHRDGAAQHGTWMRLRWLIPALAVLTLLAISNYPDVAGHRLARLPLPAALNPALDLIRASGRLFWPVAYTIVFAAVLAVYRMGRERAALVLTACVAVQAIDLSRMVTTIHAGHAEASRHRLYVRTPDPRWTAVVASAADATMVPADPIRDLALFQEIAWRATARGIPIRVAYAARLSRAIAARQQREDTAFARGIVVPGRLYVLLPGVAVPAAAATRLRTLDGVRIILPMPAPPSPRSVS